MGDRVRDAPPSLKLYGMLGRLPGALGGRSILDEHGQLWAEFGEYAAEENRVERERAALAAARRRRGGRG